MKVLTSPTETLTQFAVLGAVFAKAQKNIPIPTVGLLNVGSEEMKGPDHVRAASDILSKVEFPGLYKGFVEGDDITKGTVDVIVCDGYAGNIALKTGNRDGRWSAGNAACEMRQRVNPLPVRKSLQEKSGWIISAPRR